MPRFFAAFAITAIIIASFAAISFLGDDGNALQFNSESGTFTVFGEEYIISPAFASAAKSLYDFNGVFLGRTVKTALDNTLLFCTEFVTNALRLVYGMSEAIINNCV